MRSRPISFATPARFRSSSRRSRGSSSIAASSTATRAGLPPRRPWDTLEIPPTVQGVIASRIDRLSKEDKALLQLASVVGPRISPPLLAAVTGMPAAQLQSRLWSLEILDFLVECDGRSRREYVFAHDLIREVAYEFDPPVAARGAAPPDFDGAGSQLSTGREEDVAEALCHHAVKAQDWARRTGTAIWRRKRHSPDRRSGMPRDISRLRWTRSTSSRPRPRASSGRSICASRLDLHLFRLETSSSGSPLVATGRRVPRKSAMRTGGLRPSRSGRRR